jgi:ribonuclease HI
MSEDIFRDLEESLWRAQTRFDRAHLERVLHPDFFEFGRSGRIWTRAETLDSEPADIAAQLPLPDFAVHRLSADSVLVTYVSVTSHDPATATNRSSIWLRDGETWRLRFHQGIPAELSRGRVS